MIATPEQVRSIYTQNIGREPTPQEMAHHASNKTGLEHLTTWAQQQGGATQQKPQKVGLSTVLTSMLKNFQKFNSADRYTQLYKQNRELQEAQGMRSISPVGGSATLSPSQRASIRGGSAAALQPQVTASADVIKGKQAAATQFLNAINVARGLGKDMEDLKIQQRDSSLQAIELKAQTGQNLTPTEISEMVQLTGWDSQTVQSYYEVAKQKADLDKTLTDLKIANERKDLAAPAPLRGTAGERLAPTIASADNELRNNLQEETGYKYTDINKYRELRGKYAAQGLSSYDFDSNFASYLSPTDRIQFGIGSTTNIKVLDGGGNTSNYCMSYPDDPSCQ